jgi:hypothetical protein
MKLTASVSRCKSAIEIFGSSSSSNIANQDKLVVGFALLEASGTYPLCFQFWEAHIAPIARQISTPSAQTWLAIPGHQLQPPSDSVDNSHLTLGSQAYPEAVGVAEPANTSDLGNGLTFLTAATRFRACKILLENFSEVMYIS